MFTRYNINDLFLAHIVVRLEDSKATTGFLTILKKNGENYIDLQNLDRVVTPSMIYKIDALNKHYTQDGKRKTVTRKSAINLGKEYYSVLIPKVKSKTM